MKTLKKITRGTERKGLFVTDLDGTLLNSRRLVGPSDLQALQWLRKMGVLVVIATGRSNYSFNNLMASLGYADDRGAFPVDYVIFSTGAGVMDFPGDTIIKSFALGPQDVSCIAAYLESQGLDYMIHNPIPDTRKFVYRYHGRDNPDFRRRLDLYSEFATPLTPTSIEDSCGATELLCVLPRRQGHEVARRIGLALRGYSVIKATSPLDGESIWVEIFAPGVSKSSAAEWLCQRLNIDRRRVGAVGNDYNDVDMLRWAETGYVVANAPDELKEQFEIVSSNENNGVRQAVERWLTTLAEDFQDDHEPGGF